MNDSVNKFMTSVPEFPLAQKAVEAVGQGLDWLINEKIIGGCGSFLDNCTSAIRNIEAKALPVGDGTKSLGSDNMPMNIGKSSESPSTGRSQEIVRAPDTPQLQLAKSQAVNSVGSSHSMSCENVSNDMCGCLSPSTASVGQMRANGLSI